VSPIQKIGRDKEVKITIKVQKCARILLRDASMRVQNKDQAGEPKWLKKAEMRLKRSRRKTSVRERQALSRGFFSAG
jgi:hypothetical protein